MAPLPQNLAAEPWLSASAAISVHLCYCDVGHEQIGEDAFHSMQIIYLLRDVRGKQALQCGMYW